MAGRINLIEQGLNVLQAVGHKAIVAGDVFESATLGAFDFSLGIGGEQSKGFMKLVGSVPGGEKALAGFLKSRGADQSKINVVMNEIKERKWGDW